ncbi:MAG: hypothetical protein KF845_01130 [Cyclobacteriaceae bacterium]|nr:hypothetical protein [Cyclobacteriaceae bacterium]
MTDSVAESGLSGNYNQKHVEQWHNINSFINWPNYFIYPIRMMFSIAIITLVSYSLILMSEKDFLFTKVFYIILSGYFILFLGEIAKFVWFGFLAPEDYTLWDIREFHFLSILNFMDYYRLEDWEISVFEFIDVPLLIFIWVTANRISKTGRKSSGHYAIILTASLLIAGLIRVAYEVLL